MKFCGGYLEKTYAEALFELADECSVMDAVKEDLDFWTKLCSMEKDFEKLFFSPYFSSEYKQQFVDKVLSGKISDLAMNFLMVVIKHNRTAYLPQIIAKYHNLWETRQGYCSVEVTVAKVMTPDEVGKLSADIASAINRKIQLELSVNPYVIGGAIIRYDDKVIDNTVQSRLQKAVETIIRRGKTRKIDEV
jgi:F-type H+-transporting ATPase subunit delta